MHLIPDTWPHFHLLVSVFPSVGLIFAIGMFIASMVTKNSQMQRVGLFVFGGLAVLGVPTMFSGIWSEPALTRPGLPEDVGAATLLWRYLFRARLPVGHLASSPSGCCGAPSRAGPGPAGTCST